MMQRTKFVFGLVLLMPVYAAAADQTTAKKGFAKISSLVGEWVGLEENGQAAGISYETVAEGTTVVETFEGMQTNYTIDRDGIMAIHFCSMGNQPIMRSSGDKIGENTVAFDLIGVGNDDGLGNHIDSVKFNFISKDTFHQTWTYRSNHVTGKPFSLSYVRIGTPAISSRVISAAQVAVQKHVVAVELLQAELTKTFAAVKVALIAAGVKDIGQPFARFESFAETVTFVAGYAYVGKPIQKGDVYTASLPAGSVAFTQYLQGNDNPTGIYDLLHQWLDDHHVSANGAPWEIYMDVEKPLTGRVVVAYPFH